VADQTTIDRAMKAQLRVFRDALGAGAPRLGWKVGINDPKMLARLGLEESVVGWLDGERQLASGATYALRPGTRTALEAEVAVRLGGGGAVAAIAPAFEIVNYSRPADSFEAVLAHDLFHDAVVLGREALPVPIADGTWPHVVRNGSEIARRDPALTVMQPSQAIRMIARTLAHYGERLETGDWIILGSLVQPISIHAGDRFDADFGPLGRVAVDVSG
jgi:2-keto-4-pentenoate hydratase